MNCVHLFLQTGQLGVRIRCAEEVTSLVLARSQGRPKGQGGSFSLTQHCRRILATFGERNRKEGILKASFTKSALLIVAQAVAPIARDGLLIVNGNGV